MYRSDGRTMYRMGQLIEEILMEVGQYKSVLSQAYDEGTEFQLLEALLISNQNLSSYRSVYRTSIAVTPAVDLLFFNRQNPTSVFSQLEGLLTHVRNLASKDSRSGDSEISTLVFECYSQVRLMNIPKLLEADPETGYRKEFHEFCSRLEKQLWNISSRLSATYFSHTTYQQQGGKDGFQFEV
jgi:uncharacterized alpha-E superfamily protein